MAPFDTANAGTSPWMRIKGMVADPLLVRVWREWVAPHRGRLLLAFVLMGLVAAATGIYPLLIDQAYEMFNDTSGRLTILVPLGIVAATAVKAVAFYAQTVVTNGMVQRIVADVRIRMFDQLLTHDLAQVQAVPVATLTARFLADVEQVKAMLQRTLTGLVRDLLTVVALVGAMVWLNWQMALMILVVYPLAAVPVVRIGRRLRRIAADTQAQSGRLTALVDESLAGARMVKTYGLETYEEQRAEAAFEESYRLSMLGTRQRGLLDPLLEALGGLAVAGVIGLAGWQIAAGTGSVGAFSGFIGALLIAAQPMRAIGTLNSVLQEGLAAVQRVFAVIDTVPAIADAPDAVPLIAGAGRVELRNVTLSYPGGIRPVLQDINLTIEPGTTVALVGASGAGKSSLFNLIPRLYDVSRGAVLIDGQDVRGVTLESLRSAVAVVSQDSVLFDDSAAANIAFGKRDAALADIRQAAESAAALAFLDTLPQGLETPLGPDGNSLSGGQRQRVALARAFLKDAPILLLDEATSALDAESERLVQAALERLAAGRTTLVIAHRLSTVRHADRIVVMDGGRVVEDGDHDTLLTAGGAYARLCAAQWHDTVTI